MRATAAQAPRDGSYETLVISKLFVVQKYEYGTAEAALPYSGDPLNLSHVSFTICPRHGVGSGKGRFQFGMTHECASLRSDGAIERIAFLTPIPRETDTESS